MRDSSLSIAIHRPGLKVNVKRDTSGTPICIIIFARYITPFIRLSAVVVRCTVFAVKSRCSLVYILARRGTPVSHACEMFSRRERDAHVNHEGPRVQFRLAFSGQSAASLSTAPITFALEKLLSRRIRVSLVVACRDRREKEDTGQGITKYAIGNLRI